MAGERYRFKVFADGCEISVPAENEDIAKFHEECLRIGGLDLNNLPRAWDRVFGKRKR